MSTARQIKSRLAEIEFAIRTLEDERTSLNGRLGEIAVPFNVGDRIRERPSSYTTRRKVRAFDVVSIDNAEQLTARRVRKDGSPGAAKRLWCYGNWTEKYEKVSK